MVLKYRYLSSAVVSQYSWRLGPSWSWSYGSRIYNFLCNQCMSLLKFWFRIPLMARCTRYNIMWWSLSVTCDRFGGFLRIYRFSPTIKLTAMI